MKRKRKLNAKNKIICLRISDNEMENVRQLMEKTNMSASELMRKAFLLQVDRFIGAAAVGGSSL
jgi:hypothetical protein